MRLKLVTPTATMATAMKTTASETGASAGGEASGVSAVTEATERAGVCSRLCVKAGRAVESAAMVEATVAGVTVIEATVIETTVAEIAMMESFATKVVAVRDPVVMVEEGSTAVPVESPVTPTPTKSAEEANAKSDTKRKAWAAPKDSGHRVPARVGNDRRSIDEPRIISRDVDDLWVGGFNNDGVALRAYLLLFIVI